MIPDAPLLLFQGQFSSDESLSIVGKPCIVPDELFAVLPKP